MHIMIDIEDSEPLYAQLISQIKQSVTDGQLKPGDPLPSIRQLANDLDMNKKTVAKAFSLLERDSVIQSKGYRGSFVHPDAKINCQFDLNLWVSNKLTELLKELREAGATDSEIRIAFGNVLNERFDREKKNV